MKSQFLFLFLLFISITSFAQIEFEQGYFINNEGQRTDCLIKNVDWKYNPTEFQYKLSENSESLSSEIINVKEFGIINESKYIRATINIDRSSSVINTMSKDRNPIFKEEQLFLKVLIEGRANLYSYEAESLKRFFFSTENNSIEQLIYKSYIQPDNTIGKNISYKQQLLNSLKCSDISLTNINQLEYSENKLIKIFVQYNNCMGSELFTFKKKQTKIPLHLTIKPGLNYSSLSVQYTLDTLYNSDFEHKTSFQFGFELEYIFPFNKNKWSLYFEPTYQSYKSEKVQSFFDIKVDYKSIDFPIGIRYYFFLNQNSKIFLNGSLVYSFPIDKSYIFYTSENILHPNQYFYFEEGVNLSVGLGYNFKNKFNFEIRHGLHRGIIGGFEYWGSDYKSYSLVLGYTLF